MSAMGLPWEVPVRAYATEEGMKGAPAVALL